MHDRGLDNVSSKKLQLLRRCVIFDPLSPEQLRRLELRSQMRSHAKGSSVYLPMDADDVVYLLGSGRAKICHLTPEGKQSILTFIEAGELFGELAVLDPGPRDEYAEAVESSQVLRIPGDELRQLMLESPEVSVLVTRMVARRRKRMERRLRNLLFLSNRQRLTHLLLELAEQYGVRVSDGVQLGIRLSHQDLANIIGSTRETVTVVLGELQAEGLLRVGRRNLVLRDVSRLAQSVSRGSTESLPPDPSPPTLRPGLPLRR